MHSKLLFAILLFGFAAHGENGAPFADCYSAAEGRYMRDSEHLISLYNEAQIDRLDFERLRDVVVQNRDADLRVCSQAAAAPPVEEAPAAVPVRGASAVRVPASVPSSVYPGYEELHSTFDSY